MSRDRNYIARYGYKKCESNALFKNDETLKAGQEICRKAIETYYGEDALRRFKQKEENSKSKFKEVYDNPVWKIFFNRINKILNRLESSKEEEEIQPATKENEVEVVVDNKYYGVCPKCNTQFDYERSDDGKLVRCRGCLLLMRLRLKESGNTKEKETCE